MLSQDRFRALVAAAHKAPSPDNLQAWSFRLRGDTIEVGLPDAHRLPTDVGDMFSWIGIGAAIENLVLQAGAEGLTAKVELVGPDASDGEFGRRIARVGFVEGGTRDPLVEQLDARVTNRKPYEPDPLNGAACDALRAAMPGGGAELHLVTDPAARAKLGALVANNDWIRMSHQPFHAELFSIFRLSRAEAEAKGDGLDLASLELPAPAGLFLRLVGKWPIARTLNGIGLAKGFAKGSGDSVVACGAAGLITVGSDGPHDYVNAGRAYQRVWLAATALGLAFQPIGGLAQYGTKLRKDRGGFLPEHAAHLDTLQGPFREVFGFDQRHPALMFRVGRAKAPPLGRSLRRPLDRVIHPG